MACAIRHGAVCGGCRHGCGNLYSPLKAAVLDGVPCGSCNGTRQVDGKLCHSCRGLGSELITACPHRMVDASTWALLRTADFARKGSLPILGGTADQSDSAMKAIAYVWNTEARYREDE